MNWKKPYQFLAVVILLLTVFSMAFIKKTEEQISLTEVELGRRLFFETALSLDSSISCASCHLPQFGFADTLAFSRGVGGKLGLRNTPSIANMAARSLFFYDGRAASLEDQVHFPIEDPNEMAVSFDLVVSRLKKDPVYSAAFLKLYNQLPSKQLVAKALATFERSLETSNTVFDDFMSDINTGFSASAERGRVLFLSDRAKCFDCHFGPDFTGDEFKNIGLFDGVNRLDAGRFTISKDSSDLGKFKVPGLRNVGVTAPYMHDGSFKTLSEVIDYYSNPYQFVEHPINMDSTLMKPLNFSPEEKEDLLNFLMSLSDRQFLNR